jgi:hypothetical protein
LIAWIKKVVKNQLETNPVIMPFFDVSKGWRWFCRFYMLIIFLGWIDLVLLVFGGSGLFFLSMPEEQDPLKKMDTLRDWVLVVTVFFVFLGH